MFEHAKNIYDACIEGYVLSINLSLILFESFFSTQFRHQKEKSTCEDKNRNFGFLFSTKFHLKLGFGDFLKWQNTPTI